MSFLKSFKIKTYFDNEQVENKRALYKELALIKQFTKFKKGHVSRMVRNELRFIKEQVNKDLELYVDISNKRESSEKNRYNDRIDLLRKIHLVKNEISESRENASKINEYKLRFYHSKYGYLSFTRFKKGEIIRLSNALNNVKYFQNKYVNPNKKENHVGVEIELISKLDKDELASKLSECTKFKLGDYVEIKQDGSLRNNSDFKYTHELTVLAEEFKIKEIIEEISKLLDGNSTVNTSCGLHVHLDMRNRDVIKCYNNLVKSQKLLFKMQPKSRQKNTYCTKNHSSKWNGSTGSRYKAINKRAYDKFRTLEIRLHAGTIDYRKINNWIDILLLIVDNDQIERAPRTLKALYKFIKLSKQLEDYVEHRIKKFESEDQEAA